MQIFVEDLDVNGVGKPFIVHSVHLNVFIFVCVLEGFNLD